MLPVTHADCWSADVERLPEHSSSALCGGRIMRAVAILPVRFFRGSAWQRHFFANLLDKHMDQGITTHITKDATALGGKSWTAYLRLAIITLVAVIVSAALMHYTHAWIGLIVLLLALLYVGYRFAVIRSYRLYFDDVGVWLYSGILPWNKGIAGVKWRDLDEAVFYQSMWSWISKSYSIRIGHRFTKSSEIMLDHWARGNDAVVAINEHHQAMIRAGTLN